MSGFRTLYYTDCLPGQGLRGGAGFQFQAVSAGTGHEEMSLVQRTSLYEAPVAWMRQQRPVEEYPPSLTHLYDGLYVTARGVYLGAEANGVREGNQFTHAIATADPGAYGFTRPAQLWGAPFWSEEPAPGTECAPLPAEPDAGPWSVDSVREWVLGRPGGEDWLLAVHSAFDRLHTDGGRRVVFVADDPEPVLAWIAAGTLLLPQSRALRVGFRVFATNPRASQHDVLALHTEWAGQLAEPERDHGFCVFNLATGRRSEVEPTESARHWVARFLREDPYDVVDAIELAHQFAGGGQARAAAADRLAAEVVTLGRRPRDAAEAKGLAAWLADRIGQSSEDIPVPSVLDAVLPFPLGLTELRRLDEAVRSPRGDVLDAALTARVRRALFVAELEPCTGGRIAADEAASLRDLAEAAAEVVAPERMDALLRTVTRFGVAPRPAEFPGGADRFVRWWAAHPREPIDPGAWSCGAELLVLLRSALAASLERRGSPEEHRTVADIRERWWRLLLPGVTDPAAMIDATTTAAAVEKGGPATRRDTIEMVYALLRAPAEDYPVLLWRALFSFAEPALEELKRYLLTVPPGEFTAEWHAKEIGGAAGRLMSRAPSAGELDVIRLLASRGVLARMPDLAEFARQDQALQHWFAAVGTPPRPDPSRIPVPPPVGGPVLSARGEQFTAALLGLPFPDAAAIVAAGDEVLLAVLARELPLAWHAQDSRGEAAAALAYVAIGQCSDAVAVPFEKKLRTWARTTDAERLGAAGRRLRTLGAEVAEDWHEFTRRRAVLSGQTERAKRAREKREQKTENPPKSGKWLGRWTRGR
ncbi:hypothetical protein FNH05_05195 [Amycolatopsis rhizosphaerae]|uniref:Uncharacterized protein n=1 Tax=Amycolatopsis rhizosphaerae TaxID=2053003 RepID=A0A558DEL9_9PSEU|nr:GTPase-associated protein 1-related protein [Amycolatopsis rhizosphaerae]TVT59469.1 hypothetical protein FNH05_05195 [Amycolatopsis rhizosphaerae]